MANNRRCPNGHEYDADIYGDKCPFCPASGAYTDGNKTQIIGGSASPAGFPPYTPGAGAKTQVIGGQYQGHGEKTQIVGEPVGASGRQGDRTMVSGGGSESPTIIGTRESGLKTPAHVRRVVGLLVTYDHTPAGDVHRINEGVNSVGRAGTNSIPVTGDSEMSSHHFNITFRPVDNAYFIRDEESVNGTFVNGELLELNTSRLLNNYDVIKAGKTTFIFLAIPKLS